MSRFFSQTLSGLEPYTPGEQPRGIQNLIKLNTNESPFPPSPRVVEAIGAQQVRDLRLYSDPACTDFLAALAEAFGVPRECVFASNGSDESLAFAFRTFCDKGAAFPDVTYGFYPVFAQLFGIRTRVVPLREDWSLAPEDYKGLAETLFLANPNAPTGLALSRAEIEALVTENPERLVVVDEAYVDFGGESCVPLTQKYDNILVVGTFSKSRSLAGARLGYAVGAPSLIADLNAVKFSFNPYNVNRLTLAAGTAAVRDTAYFRECCGKIVEAREETKAALRAMGFAVTESRANFLFAAPPAPRTGAEYFAYLRENGILVRHFGAARTENYVRITIGTAGQMKTLVAVTKCFLEETT